VNKRISFPYKSYKKEFFPIIRIELKGPVRIAETEAYIDTGASTSIFRSSVARLIGIDFVSGKINYILVGNGSFIPVYMHRLPVRIGTVWLNATIGFSEHLGAPFNLLGQKDIFDRFVVSFDKRNKVVSFLPY